MTKSRRSVLALLAPLCLLLTLITSAQAAPAQTPGGTFTQYIPEEDFRPDAAPEEQLDKAHTIYWAQGITPPAMPHTVPVPGSADTMGQFYLIDGTNILETPEDVAANTGMFEYYIAPYQPGSGWYDVKKASFFDSVPEDSMLDGVSDSNMCYAASTANLIQWWLDQNRDLVTRYVELLTQKPELIPQTPKLLDPTTADQFFVDPDLSGAKSHMVRNNPVFRQMRKGFASFSDSGSFPDLAADFFFNG